MACAEIAFLLTGRAWRDQKVRCWASKISQPSSVEILTGSHFKLESEALPSNTSVLTNWQWCTQKAAQCLEEGCLGLPGVFPKSLLQSCDFPQETQEKTARTWARRVGLDESQSSFFQYILTTTRNSPRHSGHILHSAVLKHLVWSNTSGFRFWGPLAQTCPTLVGTLQPAHLLRPPSCIARPWGPQLPSP